MKQNVLLAKTEHTKAQYTQLLKNYIEAFKKNQGLFQGTRQTYEALNGYLDEPGKRGNKLVQNTIPDYLAYFVKTCQEHITNLFDIEATNASGKATAPLILEGKAIGEYSTIELLRLKGFLDNPELNAMYTALPTRSDTQNWVLSVDEEYKGKGIYQTDTFEVQNPTTIKEPYILKDPNLQELKDTGRYTPIQASRDTRILMGLQKIQFFSGETSHREKADLLARMTLIKTAVKEALVKANEAPVVKSQLTAEKIFNYIHRGDITSLTKS